MAAHEGGILVPQRHVDRRARTAALLGRGHERRTFFHRSAQRRAQFRVQDGGRMLDFPGFSDDGRLAVALRLARFDTERLHAARAEQAAQFLADGHQFVELFDVASGIRVLDDRDGDGAPRRRLDGASHLDARLIDLDDQLADSCAHVLSRERCDDVRWAGWVSRRSMAGQPVTAGRPSAKCPRRPVRRRARECALRCSSPE